MKFQKRNSAGRRKTAAVAVLLIIAVCAGVRYVSLNQRYPNPQVKTYALGETVRLGNYAFTLKEWKWQDGEILHELVPGYTLFQTEGEEYPVKKERVGLATVVVEKTEEDDTYLDLTNITFESGAWGNQWDQDLMFGINKGLDNLYWEMKKGECREIIFPITVADFYFKESDWEKIDKRDFYIVLGYYPVKHQILCKN